MTSSTAVVTTEDGNRQNMFAKEPRMYVDPKDVSVTQAERSELLNGRVAMLGFVAGFISYITTGSFFFFGALNF
jgi:hypothetical protein